MIRIKPIETPKVPTGGGTISNIAFQKQDPNRCSVFIDDAYAFGLHVDIVIRTGIAKGMLLSEDRCRELVDEDVYFKALKRCLDFITYRPRSTKEIDTRLKQLGVSEVVAEKIQSKLAEMGLMNDAEFARMFTESRIRSKGYGANRIRQELLQKGISSELADSSVAAIYSGEEQMAQLRKHLISARKKYRRELDERVRNQKITQLLLRRGFKSDQIREALQSVDA